MARSGHRRWLVLAMVAPAATWWTASTQRIGGSAMSVVAAEVQALKDAHHKTWASGDYARIAELVTNVGEQVVECAGVRAGSDVLDVAAGTGNASIPAAVAGAHVIATDLAPELFVTGRRRAQRAGV